MIIETIILDYTKIKTNKWSKPIIVFVNFGLDGQKWWPQQLAPHIKNYFLLKYRLQWHHTWRISRKQRIGHSYGWEGGPDHPRQLYQKLQFCLQKTLCRIIYFAPLSTLPQTPLKIQKLSPESYRYGTTYISIGLTIQV